MYYNIFKLKNSLQIDFALVGFYERIKMERGNGNKKHILINNASCLLGNLKENGYHIARRADGVVLGSPSSFFFLNCTQTKLAKQACLKAIRLLKHHNKY